MENVEYSGASSNAILRQEPRDKKRSILRGLRQRCPNCGEGSVFQRYLKVADSCNSCGEELYHERSDDAAPYFTIMIIGHIIVPVIVLMETYVSPSYWVYAVILLPMLIALTLLVLPRVKGALVGLQWALYMHGFDQDEATIPSAHFAQEFNRPRY